MMINFNGHFTCDNSYSVWIGSETAVREKLIEATNTTASQIGNGESVSGIAAPFEYLYLVAWSDDSVYQGLLGTFDGGKRVNTGDPRWQVLPTGNNKGNQQFPTAAELNSELSAASQTDWVTPWVGPQNNNAQPWGWTISGVPQDALWTWHDSGKQPAGSNPLAGFNHDEYLIFRMPIAHLADVEVSVINGECCRVTTIVECTCDDQNEHEDHRAVKRERTREL